MAQLTITFNSRELDTTEECPGVVKYKSGYYVQCSITKEWCVCSQERLYALIKKFGSMERLGKGYVSRAGNRIEKGEPILPKAPRKPREKPEPTPVDPNRKPFVWIDPALRYPCYDGETWPDPKPEKAD